MTTTPAPTAEITDELREQAREWIRRNGQPVIPAVESAIRITALHGDRRNENPFRHALIAEATR